MTSEPKSLPLRYNGKLTLKRFGVPVTGDLYVLYNTSQLPSLFKLNDFIATDEVSAT